MGIPQHLSLLQPGGNSNWGGRTIAISASGWSSTLTHSLNKEASCRRTTQPQNIHSIPDSTKGCTVGYCQLTFTKNWGKAPPCHQGELSQTLNINIFQGEGKSCGCLCLNYCNRILEAQQQHSSSFGQYNGLQIGKRHRRTQPSFPFLLRNYCKTQVQEDAGGGGQTAENGTAMARSAALPETWLVHRETPHTLLTRLAADPT